MYLLRQIEESDADQVYQLAMQAHAGVTSLPKNRELIQKKIERSLDSFRHVQQKRMEGLLFLFVLENLATNQLVGVSGFEPAEHLGALTCGRAHQLTAVEVAQQRRFRGRPSGRGAQNASHLRDGAGGILPFERGGQL